MMMKRRRRRRRRTRQEDEGGKEVKGRRCPSRKDRRAARRELW
jgi:hypothetical protein